MKNKDKGNAVDETTCNDINVKRSWTETNSGLKLGVFVQEITFLDEGTSEQVKKSAPSGEFFYYDEDLSFTV